MNDGRFVQGVAAYRSGLTWQRPTSSLSIATTYDDQGLGRQLGAEIAGYLNVRQFKFRGGAEAARGGLFGADTHAWAGMELPLTKSLAFLLGVDYESWDDQTMLWGDDVGEVPKSPWRGTFGIRRKLTIPSSLFAFHPEPPKRPTLLTNRPVGTPDQ